MKSFFAALGFGCAALYASAQPSSFYTLANNMPDGPGWNSNWVLNWTHDGESTGWGIGYGMAYAERFRTFEIPVSITKVEVALLNFNEYVGLPESNRNLTIEIVGGDATSPNPNNVLLTVATNPAIQPIDDGAFPPPTYTVSTFLTTPTLLAKQSNYWLILRPTTQNLITDADDMVVGWAGGPVGDVAWTFAQYSASGTLGSFVAPTISGRGAFAIYVDQDPQIGSVPEPSFAALIFAAAMGVVLLRKTINPSPR